MKKILILSLITAAMLLVACSEENNTAEEFPNWPQKNESYFNALYADASKGSSGNSSWKTLRKWSLQDDVTASASDHIVVRVIENGEGTETPLYTDSVAVIYSG